MAKARRPSTSSHAADKPPDGSFVVELYTPLKQGEREIDRLVIRAPEWGCELRWKRKEIPSVMALLAELCDVPEQVLLQLAGLDLDRVKFAFAVQVPFARKDMLLGVTLTPHEAKMLASDPPPGLSREFLRQTVEVEQIKRADFGLRVGFEGDDGGGARTSESQRSHTPVPAPLEPKAAQEPPSRRQEWPDVRLPEEPQQREKWRSNEAPAWFKTIRKTHPQMEGEDKSAYARRLHGDMAKDFGGVIPWDLSTLRRRLNDPLTEDD